LEISHENAFHQQAGQPNFPGQRGHNYFGCHCVQGNAPDVLEK